MADQEICIRQIVEDPALLQQFITRHETFILSCASTYADRRVTKNDDEWSIALEGFVKAMNRYDENRGNFISFAGVVIHNMLVDHYRQAKRTAMDLSGDNLDGLTASDGENEEIKLEIQCLDNILKTYDITFEELAATSPKAKKTKMACAKAIQTLLDERELNEILKTRKRLPMGKLSEKSGVSIKILDRHRQYIIAVIEILDNDFLYLREYAKALWR